MANHVKPKGRQCSHRRYMLDCAEYDALVDHADGRCQICGRTGPETGHGYLVVDHDPFVADWAVRGLLCSRCNLQITYLRLPEKQMNAYLANPWYARKNGIEPAKPGPKKRPPAVERAFGEIARIADEERAKAAERPVGSEETTA